ncbi:uncharacterized protein K460DRAFT_334049 [Cucurbitaria berberidis CBS 394.84]|uniref:Uncharacterized protein n=1 Tax=Cucurbitaria berberidis CBS 394.84 TaxID=1168544 RepID=A0A9P4GNE5_9PLEO|nr:uncharacterized protein K460DRAFT_334049 [Cucurbitaria berberidis CBS 394.84]KAF1848231.1 hypothetical protein K460DRAFT_334049 [Cucurbitaria berberidis CBS 394.84]
MPGKRSIPKERYERQRKAREIRRALAAITPENSRPQRQSPLFSVLPAELRVLIFQFVLSQALDLARPLDIHCNSPLYRPGHTHHATLDISLLLTCRLVYCEAHTIPVRSATYHFGHLSGASCLYNDSAWLHHVTKQHGAELYHLHDNVISIRSNHVTKFLLPHLHWRKITWTVCGYLLTPRLYAEQTGFDSPANTLAGLTLPASCKEVTLELETREDLLDDWPQLLQQAKACQQVSLMRSDGTTLELDNRYVVRYKWVGSGQLQEGIREDALLTKYTMVYHTIRLCWRAKLARREYMSYDRLDCLRLEGCAEVTEIMALE